MIERKTTVYVCEDTICKLPTANLKQIKRLLSDVKRIPCHPSCGHYSNDWFTLAALAYSADRYGLNSFASGLKIRISPRIVHLGKLL